MSYTIDVYRGDIKTERNFFFYALFVSFFPQLVAGPIERPGNLIPQLKEPKPWNNDDAIKGAKHMIVGFFKKVAVADLLSLYVNEIYNDVESATALGVIIATAMFAVQIYCDFSGYSDMAIGIALLLGFRFPKNFDAPYKSATITEFWRRWHISLSSWLRDYLYISLGGNRRGTARTYLNLIITMVLGGLWHGAAVRFILWGALHGVALALHKMWLSVVPWAKAKGADMNPLMRVLGIILTFHVVCLGWLLFRAEDMNTVHLMLYQIFHSFNTSIIPQFVLGYKEVMAFIVLGYFMHFMPSKIDSDLQHKVGEASFWWQVAMLVAVVWCVMQIKSSSIQPFIYFQF